jgi:hypothetical protein
MSLARRSRCAWSVSGQRLVDWIQFFRFPSTCLFISSLISQTSLRQQSPTSRKEDIVKNRRPVIGLGTAAGAALGAALLSGLASPLAAADTYAPEPIPVDLLSEFNAAGITSNPMIEYTLPAFGGAGTETLGDEILANYDTTTGAFVTDSGSSEFGLESLLVNTYSNPIFTDTSTDILSSYGGLAGDAVGTTDDTFWFAPFGYDLLGLETNPSEILLPGGTDIPLGGDLTPLTSLLDGSDFSSFSADIAAALDPVSALGAIDPLSFLGF